MTKMEAKQVGKKLLSKVRGKGWKLVLWENMGWHFAIQNPPLDISQTSDGELMILMSNKIDVSGTGSILWTLDNENICSKNPRILIQRQANEARRVINQLLAVVEKAEAIARDEA